MRKGLPARLDPRIPVVAVDVAILTVVEGRLRILLIKVKKKPYSGLWALPGGIIRPTESLDQAAYRELAEQTGVKNVYLEQLYTFGEVRRDKTRRAVSTVYFALLNPEGPGLKTSPKYGGVDWFPVNALLGLAYDHAQVIQYAVQRLRWKLEYTNVAWSLLPETFTLSELQSVYQAILGKTLDKRNFRKRILSLDLVVSTGRTRLGGAYRPAALYRFTKRKPMIVRIL